ncbi:putative ABC transporter C family member 15 isoform X2 [Impatiens glandulifera]|uniref:putative ABC transporter C family member 15 isoform X2 n=1 Tax=Impatiens glandulifera TaxID=253017 RepID=UPI001FB0DFCD|nr:putative ABC transporter C family member 15 isoform X2 [Impatiens glandulifera]
MSKLPGFSSKWSELYSPCLWVNSSIILQLGFLATFFLHSACNMIYSLCKHGRKTTTTTTVDHKYSNGGKSKFGLTYKISIFSSILLLSTHLLMLLVLQSRNDGCNSYAEILQVTTCAVTIFALYRVAKTRQSKIPLILRGWWLLNFFLVSARLVLDARLIFTAREYGDLIEFLLSAFLMGISIRGKSGIQIEFSDSTSEEEPLLHRKRTCLYENTTIFQRISFSWLNPLFSVGNKKPLEQNEVPDVDFNDSAAFLSCSFDECLKRVKESDGSLKPSIYKAIYLLIRKKAAINAFFAVINAISSYVGPYLIEDFVNYLNEKETKSLKTGYLIALGFLVAKMIETISQRQWIFGARQLGLRLRAALISHIYKKGLILSSQARQSRTSGEIVNYMSVDIQRITDFIWYMNTIWMLPIQIFLAITILHKDIGLGSIVSLATTLFVMAINIPLTRTNKAYQSKIMDAKDERMKSTTEILRNMKTLKLQAWDNHYLRKMESLRRIEYNWIWKSLRLQAIMSFIFWGSPTFISASTFVACLLMGIPLTSGRVLSALATFQMLQSPIFNLPDLLNVIAQGKVSADRIASYLQEDEIKTDAVMFVVKDQTEYSIEIDNGRFSWDSDTRRPTLDSISLRVKKGMRVAICGTVGSGKSSLLSCILGEMDKISGTVMVGGSTAYVPQSAWIQSGNVRDNILFGSPYDIANYHRTVKACALIKDLELFSAGDLTEIGERGINMSGGQKQRIQIARSVYQDADIYLLDDPFSAVDAHTGRQLFEDCIMGILKDKTILYVTHQVEFLPAADLILVMQNGQIKQAGTFKELLDQNTGFEVLVGAHSQALESVAIIENSSREHQENGLDSETIVDSHSVNGETLQTQHELKNDLSEEINDKEGKLVHDEEREKGRIAKEVYLSYLTAVRGGALVPIIILAQSTFQALQIASNYWMAWSCPSNSSTKSISEMKFVLLVYVLLAFGSSFCVLVRSTLVAIAGLLTAENFFTKMLHSVFHAPMAFFDSTPTGRILNRVSSDQSVLDLEMANRLGSCAFALIQLLGTIIVMSQVAWEVFAILVPVTAICILYQQYYIPTARELARLSEIQRAPILHHFAESLTGATTIRAFNQKDRFTDVNLELIDGHSRPWFHNVVAMEWLSFRLNQLSNFVFAFSLILLVSLPEGVINPSIAGLTVTYGINLNVLQASFIWSVCNAENKIISVERILQYTKVPSESPMEIEESRPSNDWPENGTISFANLQIRYAEHLPSVLKNITCTFPGGKKIGVVGRTGSGKSTLIQAIFRIIEPREGSIIIDDVDISKIGLHDLRSRLSIIPQDPTLFEGTVRGNLDPLQQHSDHEIWQALDKCQLGDLVSQKEEKLDSPVVENGENWSVGQRQLFCLGRALLKKSTILVLDEATASVDSATDGVIQKIISQEFEDRTVVTIAHRIHTVIESDFILVLSDGRIAEFDSPTKLLENSDSFFSKLIKEYSSRSQGFSSLTNK